MTCGDCQHWERWEKDKDGNPTNYPIGDCFQAWMKRTTPIDAKACRYFETVSE